MNKNEEILNEAKKMTNVKKKERVNKLQQNCKRKDTVKTLRRYKRP